MKYSAAKLASEQHRGGPGVSYHNQAMFSVAQSGKTKYLFIRVGREIAKKVGLRPGDMVDLTWNPETREGWIEPAPIGRKLITGDEKVDTPPVIFKQTWSPKLPFIAEKMAMENVTLCGSHGIKFTFPKETVFADMPGEETTDELYQEHKKLIESNRPIKRRKPTTKDGKPYGRRAGD